MLIFDFRAIGNKLLSYRKKAGMTQIEVADAAGLADRTYAEIERGSANMRIETLLRICKVLQITPDDILTDENTSLDLLQDELLEQLSTSSPHDRETALRLLSVYLQSR